MSFQQGLSGLNASSKNLEIIGNNIANANTFGAKTARGEFAAVYATALNGAGTNTVGIGTTLSAVAQQFTQGNVSTTDNPMDLAINGAGFFQISDGRSPVTYTRNGQFKVDRDGFIVNNSLEKLMGYPADGNGVIQPGQAVPLQLPTGGIDPRPTSRAEIEMNLDSRKAVTLPAAAPQIDFGNANTYNNATSLTVFDAKGQDIAMSFYFQKAANDQWNVYATSNGSTVGGVPAAPLPITTINFQSNGSAPIAPAGPFAINVPASVNAVGAQTEPINGLLIDVAGATQFGSSFGVTNINQDGYTSGLLTAVAVESNGVVTARYSNGQSKPSGQIEIANFRNPQGLQPIGDNAWARTFGSGDPIMGVPGDGNL
ncbi:MAG TPA: flagellar hook protein FlgE, partial [Rubrivivax sp.]|nr:flagellar hook protein FlgE [Rubrivivax sp.]